MQELRGGIDIIIATPGRLLELVDSRRIIILSRLQFLVVDEADKMLDLNLEPTLKRLVSANNLEVGSTEPVGTTQTDWV